MDNVAHARDLNPSVVASAMDAFFARKKKRQELLNSISPSEINDRIATLRVTMFSRHRGDEAFHELTEDELALLETSVGRSSASGSLTLVGDTVTGLKPHFEILRYNYLSGDDIVSQEMFRSAADKITDKIISYVHGNLTHTSHTIVMVPWRAGLAFCTAAVHHGLHTFYHIGVKRNEQTLKTELYFEEKPSDLQTQSIHNYTAIITDPMLASGNTMVDSIKRLKDQEITEENISVCSIIAAPEGVDHILHQFSKIKIIVGALDERLNSQGYIVPGLGDFGDRYFEGLDSHDINRWRTSKILTDTAAHALLIKMGITPLSSSASLHLFS